jgi:trimeric autotransporter adhesin
MKLFFLLVLFSSLLFTGTSFSQCPFDNTNVMTVTIPSCPGSSTVTCLNGGESVTVNVTAGNDYIFSTCSTTTFDSELTLYDATGAVILGYNDDFCGLQSQITWNATYTGTVEILLDEYSCISNGTCMDLTIDCAIPVAGGTGCNTDNSICSSGVAGPFGFGLAGTDPNNCQSWLSSSQFSYIVLYVTQSGPLNLLIDGDQTTGFLDVSIYNVPNGSLPCSAVLVPANLIGCNFASNSSGCNEFGPYFGCLSTVPAPNVVAGQQLMIIVEDYADGASSTFTLELAPVPAAQTGAPDATITPVGPYCESDATVQLQAVNMGGDWTGPGVSLTGIFDPAAAGPGTHTITYSIGASPCDATETTTIVVNATPVVTVNSQSICAGETTVLTATPSPAAGGTYVWTPAGLGTADAISISPTVTTTYSVVYTLATCVSNSASGTVTVNPFPPFTVTGTDPTICNASDGFITISSLTPSNSYTITYTDDGVVQPSVVLNSDGAGNLILNTLNSGTYTDITVASGACSLVSSSTINLTNPGAPIINSMANQAACDSYLPPSITGTNLTGAEAYYNGSQAAGGITLSGPITSTQQVWMYDINGSCADEKSFMVTITPTPTVTVSNASVCAGTTAVLTATPSSPGGSYTWTPAGLGTVDSISVSPLTTTTYSVVYTLNNCPSVSATGTVTILTIPSFTLSGTDPSICNASDGFITLSGLTPSTAYTLSYSDDGTVQSNNSITTDGAGSYTITSLNSGSYTDFTISQGGCSLVNSNAVVLSNPGAPSITNPGPQTTCDSYALPPINGLNLSGTEAYYNAAQSAGGITISGPITSTQVVWIYDLNGSCSDEKSFTVTINPTPTVLVDSATICVGASAILTATPSTSGGTYNWTPTYSTQSIVVSPTTTSSYTVIYTLNSCPSSSVSGTVTVNPIPVVSVDNPSVCEGGTTTITATPQINGGTYLWNTSETTAMINSAPAADTTYTVVYTLNGCASIPASGTVTVSTAPPLSAGSDIEICSGVSGTIGINPTVGNTYLWTPNQSGLSTPTNSMTTVTLTNTTSSPVISTYTVEVTTPQGCTSTDDVLVTVHPIPTVDFSADIVSGCAPLSVVFTNLSSPVSSSASWNFGDGSTSASTAQTLTHTFTGSGCKDITLNSTSNGCSSSLTLSQMVCILPNSIASFGVNQPSTTVLNPSFDFYNYSQNANQYAWNFGDATLSSDPNPSHVYAEEENSYSVTLVASTDGVCADTATLTILVKDILVYFIPNSFTPDGDNYNQTFQPVFSSGFDPLKYELIIFNRWGEIMFESHDSEVGWDGSYGGRMVPDGTYVWRVKFSDSTTDKKYIDSGSLHIMR